MSVALRERREELELVAAEAERARAGAGRLVLLRGATGTGRTALLEAAAEQAEAAGMRVLRARCSPDHTSVPFGAVFQLLAHGPGFDSAAGRSRTRPAPRPTGAGPRGCGDCCVRTRMTCRSWWPWTTCTSPTSPRAAGWSRRCGGSTDYRY